MKPSLFSIGDIVYYAGTLCRLWTKVNGYWHCRKIGYEYSGWVVLDSSAMGTFTIPVQWWVHERNALLWHVTI